MKMQVAAVNFQFSMRPLYCQFIATRTTPAVFYAVLHVQSRPESEYVGLPGGRVGAGRSRSVRVGPDRSGSVRVDLSPRVTKLSLSCGGRGQ